MKVKNIKNDLFSEIKNKSFDRIKEELNETSKQLSKTLGIDFRVSNINESYVLYSSPNPNAYLKASYSFTDRDTVKLENFETLVIDAKSIEDLVCSYKFTEIKVQTISSIWDSTVFLTARK